MTASDGWIAEPPAGATTAYAYVEIQNPTMYDVYVVSAASDAAGAIQLREAGPGKEGKAVKEITVPAYGSLTLEPGGPHLLLTDLKRPLKAAETVALTLTTDIGVVLKVPAIVR